MVLRQLCDFESQKMPFFMTLGNGNNLFDFSCDGIIIKNSLSEKILGLTIDNNLDFRDHISYM